MADKEEIKQETKEEEIVEETEQKSESQETKTEKIEEETKTEEIQEETIEVEEKPKRKRKKRDKFDELDEKLKEGSKEEKKPVEEGGISTHIYTLRTTANREDQVMDFLTSNASKKKLEVYSVIRPHGMRGYIMVEAATRSDAEQAAFNIPYARGILQGEIKYKEIEHMLEQVKKEANIKKNDIAEIISGPFKREKCKITRVDAAKEEVVVELLEAAVPIPITVKIDAVRVIRREGEEATEERL
jgi:transcriptional antiterminator NusG